MNLELARKIVPHPCSAAAFGIVPFLFRDCSAKPSKSSGVNGMYRCALFRLLLQTQSRTDGTHRPPYKGACSATVRAGLSISICLWSNWNRAAQGLGLQEAGRNRQDKERIAVTVNGIH